MKRLTKFQALNNGPKYNFRIVLKNSFMFFDNISRIEFKNINSK